MATNAREQITKNRETESLELIILSFQLFFQEAADYEEISWMAVRVDYMRDYNRSLRTVPSVAGPRRPADLSTPFAAD
jgi:hypothetical protein